MSEASRDPTTGTPAVGEWQGPEPLKVLRIIARLNIGGPARHVTILDRGLKARGFVTLLAHGEVGPDEGSLEHLADQARVPSVRVPGLGRRISLLSDLRAFASLLRLVFRMRPDVVHTHTAKAGTLGRSAALLYNLCRSPQRRCVVVHTFHGHVLHAYFGPAASKAIRVLERSLGRISDLVLVLSERQRQDIAERYRIADASRVRIVALGLELQRLTCLAPHRDDRPGVVFGFVGRFVPVKNVPLLIEAFAVVHRQFPRCRLVLFGDGELNESLRSLAAERGVASSVEFAGWRDALDEVYSTIDVLVLTSVNEGTPVAVIEAMAAALPVIATDVGGVPDIVNTGETGLLVRSDSRDDLAAAMVRLVLNREERRRLGVAGREAVRTRFSAERLVDEMASLYRREVESKRSR